MGRPRLSVMAVVQEALGFAVHRFGAAIRVAWLPVVLLLVLQVFLVSVTGGDLSTAFQFVFQLEPGWVTKFVQTLLTGAPILILLGFLGAALQSSYMVPLIQYAANGDAPSHRSVHLSFGVRHVKYILAAALAFALLITAAGYLAQFATDFTSGSLRPLLDREQAVFAEGSLHSVEVEPVYGPLQSIVQAVDVFLFSLGVPAGLIDLTLLLPIMLLAGYLMLRLLAWPYVVAASPSRTFFGGMGESWRLTGGTNILSVFAIVIVFFALGTLTLYVTYGATIMVLNLFLTGSGALVAGLEAYVPDTPVGDIVQIAVSIVIALVLISVTIFIAAFQAGIGGALVHASRRD